jgi:hypothetical protein
VTPPRCIRRVPCSMNTRTCSLLRSTVSTCRKSTATIPTAGRAGTAASPDPSAAVPDRCRQHAGSPTRWTARLSRRLCEFAVDPAVSPQRILPRQADDKAGDARDCRRASRLAPLARVVLPRRQPAVPGQQCRGRHGKTSAQRLRGTSRASAANQARSAGSYRTRPTCRRSTAFSCLSTSSSASFAWSPRNIRTARPSTRHVSK